MKLVNYLILIFCVSLLYACKKETKSPFSETTYITLGTFDSTGLPNYMVEPDKISPKLQTFINVYLKEGKNLTQTNPELFANNSIADIVVTKPVTIYMTFVSQSAGAHNAIAYYTYPTNQPPKNPKDIKTMVYAFPSAGAKTPLKPGDKVELGKFSAGISVGFVLLMNAWDPNSGSLNNKAIHYLTNDVLNPEKDPALRKHAVLIEYPEESKILIGFEDTNREHPICDNDFNDTVIYCTLKY